MTTPPRKRGRPTGPPQVKREISLPVDLDAAITSTALPPRGYSRRVVELVRLGLTVEQTERDQPQGAPGSVDDQRHPATLLQPIISDGDP